MCDKENYVNENTTTRLKSKLRHIAQWRDWVSSRSDARLGIDLISSGRYAAAAADGTAWAVAVASASGELGGDEGGHEEGDKCALKKASEDVAPVVFVVGDATEGRVENKAD